MDIGVVVLVGIVTIIAVTVFHRRMQQRRLERAIRKFDLQMLTEMGWRIEHETDDQVVMVRNQKVNHILHLLLSIFTVGAWLLVWAYLAATGGEKRRAFPKPRATA